MSNILSLNKVSRSYSVREKVINVFSDLDIFIEKGEKVAIIGPSGSLLKKMLLAINIKIEKHILCSSFLNLKFLYPISNLLHNH